MYYQEKLAVQPALEAEPNEGLQLTVPPEQLDLSKITPPKDEEYLIDDSWVVQYVMNSSIPEDWTAFPAHKRELEKRNMTAKFE
jgi:hypothetical protein